MSKEHNHIEHLTPELIRQYRAGELSADMKHAIEKYLLENPFEAEAFEGLELIANEEVEAHVIDLHERIDEATQVSEVDKGATEFWAYTRRIAAVVLLLLVAGLAYVWLRPALDTAPMSKELTLSEVEDDFEELAEVKSKTDDADAESEQSDSPQIESDTTGDDITFEIAKEAPQAEQSALARPADQVATVAKEKELDSLQTAYDELYTAFADRQEKLEDEMASQRAKSTQRMSMAGIESKAVAAAPVPVNNSADSVLPLKQLRNTDSTLPSQPIYDAKALTYYTNAAVPVTPKNGLNLPVYGKVTDAITGLAITGATVTAGNIKSLTDENGFFVAQPDSLSRLLSVAYTGYEPKEYYGVKGTNLMNINLQPSAQSLQGQSFLLDELPYMKRKSATSNVVIIKSVSEFEAYAAQNLQYPDAARSQNIKGKVVLEFTLSAIGKITSINVVKGLGFGCDEEAIRLLQEVPFWMPKTNKKTGQLEAQKIRVKVRFKP